MRQTICPYCGYKAECHETLEKDANVRDGDISFCIGCGEVSIFTKNGLRMPNFNELKGNMKLIHNLRISWLKIKAQIKVNPELLKGE